MPRSPNLDHIYAAIADPTRRAIIGLLVQGGTTVGDLANRFPMSFNGVSKHVKVLERAGLVQRRVSGREHWLTLRPKPLGDAARWLDTYREFWEDRLAALEHMLIEENGAPGRPRPK